MKETKVLKENVLTDVFALSWTLSYTAPRCAALSTLDGLQQSFKACSDVGSAQDRNSPALPKTII